MPTPYSNYKKATLLQRYLVDVRSSYYKAYNNSYIYYNLRITFKEFEKLAITRTRLLKEADTIEDKLEEVETEAIRLIIEAHKKVTKARTKAQQKRKELRFIESKEDSSYQRKLATIEAIKNIKQEASTTNSISLSIDDLLASLELLDFSNLRDFNLAILATSPFTQSQITSSIFPIDTSLLELLI